MQTISIYTQVFPLAPPDQPERYEVDIKILICNPLSDTGNTGRKGTRTVRVRRRTRGISMIPTTEVIKAPEAIKGRVRVVIMNTKIDTMIKEALVDTDRTEVARTYG